MELGGVGRDAELKGDLLVGQTVGEKRQNLALAVGERAGFGRLRPGERAGSQMAIQHDDALRRRDERRCELASAVSLVAPDVAPAGESVGLGQRREVAGGRVAQHDERRMRPARFESGDGDGENVGRGAGGVEQNGVHGGHEQGGQKRLGARGGLSAKLQAFFLAQ